MKRIILLASLVMLLAGAQTLSGKSRKEAAAPAPVTFATEPRQPLRFRADSTFRILQITDTHLRDTMPEEEQKVHGEIRSLVETEDPDVIVLTGDIVTWGKGEQVLRRLVSFLDSLELPWIVMYGNHDAESGMSRPFMSELYVAGRNSLNILNSKGELADVELPVRSHDGHEGLEEAPFYIFCMDSGDYIHIDGKRYYHWFSQDQTRWMRESCAARTDTLGHVAPALAFFHIELREYMDAWASRDNPRWREFDFAHTEGARGENNGSGPINSGMFAAMYEGGSVIGTSVGHAHDSDFVAVLNHIALCYGRYSGGDTVYNHLPPGGRVFVLRQGIKGFETWVREYNGRVLRHVYFNGDYLIRPRGRNPFGSWVDIAPESFRPIE